MQKSNDVYLNKPKYDRLITALVAAAQEPDPVSGLVPDPDRLKTALGEFGDIWPESIADDASSDQ